MTQEIVVPVSTMWSEVRRVDNPHAYKHFVKSCHVIKGGGDVGTMREVQVISGCRRTATWKGKKYSSAKISSVGNIHGVLVGREVFSYRILYASRESHYSIFKAAIWDSD
ncbi:hypothetical protein ACFX15_037273 [Malus domestica]|uniref:Uncharacterized protein n=1 Tax=Malus domestica TaxID=3750 RepID=A0A498JPJ0_MALDO|nr:hypothetical protein DVH24_036038 [Malus domestica]